MFVRADEQDNHGDEDDQHTTADVHVDCQLTDGDVYRLHRFLMEEVEAKQKQPDSAIRENGNWGCSGLSLDWPYGRARNAGNKKPARPFDRRVLGTKKPGGYPGSITGATSPA